VLLEYYITGIKTDRDGKQRYKLRYECPECGEKGNHYVYPDSLYVKCHKCKYKMLILLAGKKYMERDTFGNYFRAGNFIDRNIHGWD